jgi:chemotaxis protein CheD
MSNLATRFVGPGQLIVPHGDTPVSSVVTWGILVTCFHEKSGEGALAHFLYPRRHSNGPSSALFAAPAIVTLIRHFTSRYSKDSLDIHVLGGAYYDGASNELRHVAEENIHVAKEILEILKIKRYCIDVGGKRARRVLFQPTTGELLVAKVEQARREDWMYNKNGPILRGH